MSLVVLLIIIMKRLGQKNKQLLHECSCIIEFIIVNELGGKDKM